MSFWYISFANDEGFLGGTVVSANSASEALIEATTRGLNPGGEAAIIEVPRNKEGASDVAAMFNRLLNKEEVLAQGGIQKSDLPQQMKTAFDEEFEFICADCNTVH